jgi:hypothetical protein
MNNSAHFSFYAPSFAGRTLPESGYIVGYAAIIQKLGLQMPIPRMIAMITTSSKKYVTKDLRNFPRSYLPDDNTTLSEINALYNHLIFALKYEGVNLLLFRKLTAHYNMHQLTELVSIEPSGQYSRRIWFLIEWLMGKELPGILNLSKKSYVLAVDPNLQFTGSGIRSPRHMVFNNLPGTADFCPMVDKTKKLVQFINEDFSIQREDYFNEFRKELLQRASSFLLLKDSKASFSIEGESPKSKRAARWGKAIGQAGTRELTIDELCRLQQIVIENDRFLKMGLRTSGGFVGEHDRYSGEPIPDHISARPEDLECLMNGLITTSNLLIKDSIDSVIAAAKIAFGFVYIHPFVDGNGRIHRFLIHHILAIKNFSQQGIIFPISASILDHIRDYREVLEGYSKPLLDFIDWKETPDHNIQVLNDTIDFYKYMDLTPHSEFLFECVKDTLKRIIPEELNYLNAYDSFKQYIDSHFDMPDSTVALLIQFLEKGNGQLSKRARNNEFNQLNEEEITMIEKQFKSIFKEY